MYHCIPTGRAKKGQDRRHGYPILILTLLLLCVGLIMLFSASYVDTIYNTKGHDGAFTLRTGDVCFAGHRGDAGGLRFNYHKLHYFALPLMVVSLLLLAAVIPFGVGTTARPAG